MEATQRNINGLGLSEVKETKIEGNILKVTLSDNSVVEIVGVNTNGEELASFKNYIENGNYYYVTGVGGSSSSIF